MGVVNAAKLINLQSDTLLAEDLKSFDLVIADGIPVVWASKILGQSLPECATDCDLMYRFFEFANKRQWRVYCLAATKETSEKGAENLAKEHPYLTHIGSRNGYFSAEDGAVIFPFEIVNAFIMAVGSAASHTCSTFNASSAHSARPRSTAVPNLPSAMTTEFLT